MPGPVSESLGLRLLAVLALVLANAFFVAAEFALVAARRTRIEALVRRGDRKARTVQAALQDLYRQLSAAQLGITVASILLGYVAEDTVAHLFRDWFAALPPALSFLTRGGVASVVAVAVITFLHSLIGDQSPTPWAIPHTKGRGPPCPGGAEPLGRRPAHLLLLDHPAVHRSPQLERQRHRPAHGHQEHHAGARPRTLPRGDPHARPAEPQDRGVGCRRRAD